MAAITAAATARTESRGCHRRADAELTLPQWRRHLVSTLNSHALQLEVRP
jgi:aspartate oxidase